MSFLSSPAKYFREALEARRDRERQRRLLNQSLTEVDEAQAPSPRRKVVFGARKNLHDHRDEPKDVLKLQNVQPLPHNISNKQHENKDHLPEIPQHKSISKIFDSVFLPEDYENFDLHPADTKSSFGDDSLDTDYSNTISEATMDEDDEEGKATGDKRTKKPAREIPTTIQLPEQVPSGPILLEETNCCGPFRCNRFYVSKILQKDFHRQTQFLKRVITFLTCQILFVIISIILVMSIPQIKNPILSEYNLALIPLGIFIITKIILRSVVKIRKLYRPLQICIAAFRTICIAYYCAAVSAYSKSHAVLLTAMNSFMTELFFSVTTNYNDYDVTNPEIVGMAAVVNAAFSLALLVIYTIVEYEGRNTFLEIMVKNWMPSFFASEFIVVVLMFDIKQIMGGWRFPLTEADWLYTVLYV